jgi:hypothetical protein
MFLNVPLIADWQAMHVLVNIMSMRIYDVPIGSNNSTPGQKVLKKVHNSTKLGVRTEGPYTIEHVHLNGNLTILLHEGITEFHIPL